MTRKASSKRTRSIAGCSSSESSPAAEIIADNADLLTEILLRLPAKSLLRFKCVSKHWLSLISASQFARLHSRRNPRPPISGLYCFRNRQLESISLNGGPTDLPSLSFLDGPGGGFRVRIIHSCNGLLLCKKFPTVGDGKKSQLIVCNPTTGKYVVIPEPGGDSYESGCLAFDPSKSPHYKMVLVSPPSSPSLEINIFSSEPASWRKIFHIDRGFGEGFLWNGAIHWLCDPYSFLRFDVEAEEIIGIPFPSCPKIRSLDQIKYFGECGGCLILIHSHSPSAMGYRILEMDKDYRHWIVRCQVNLRPLISAFSEIITGKYHDYFSVLCVVEGEKENDFALVLAIPGKVISYQPKSKTWNVLRELAPGDVNYNDYVYPFVQSLAPVYAPMFF